MVGISKAQLSKFHQLNLTPRNANEPVAMLNTFRKPQPLNSRTVFEVKTSMLEKVKPTMRNDYIGSYQKPSTFTPKVPSYRRRIRTGYY